MNREDTKVVPFRTAASPYNAETEKKRNVIGQQLAKAVRDCGYSKKAFCEVLKNYGVDVTHSALGKWTNGLTVPSAYQLVAICHALHIEEGISYFTGSYVSELNEIGMAKMRSYRDDLIAFIDHELEQLAKKSSANKPETENQKNNETSSS